MLKPESAPNLNNPELNHTKKEVGVNANELLEDKSMLGESKKLEAKTEAEEGQEQEVKKLELSPEEQIKNLDSELRDQQQETIRLTKLVKETKAKLNEALKELGLSPVEKDPPSISSEKNKLKDLQEKQEALEKQKEKLISQQEKERLIQEEKEKILQKKFDELFKEFEALNPNDFESIFKSGKTREGGKVESSSMGELDPEIAKSLAKTFKEGIKLLPKILEALPELLKKFDEDLTKEATERVDKKLEEEKQKMGEEQKKEESPEEPQPKEKPEVPEEEIPSDEVKPKSSQIKGGNIGTL